jgi:hypothetical protein
MTLFSELVRFLHQFGKFCIDFCAVTKRSETPLNISFGSNGLDWVHSLQKIPMQLDFAIFGVNGASSASFASTFLQ